MAEARESVENTMPQNVAEFFAPLMYGKRSGQLTGAWGQAERLCAENPNNPMILVDHGAFPFNFPINHGGDLEAASGNIQNYFRTALFFTALRGRVDFATKLYDYGAYCLLAGTSIEELHGCVFQGIIPMTISGITYPPQRSAEAFLQVLSSVSRVSGNLEFFENYVSQLKDHVENLDNSHKVYYIAMLQNLKRDTFLAQLIWEIVLNDRETHQLPVLSEGFDLHRGYWSSDFEASVNEILTKKRPEVNKPYQRELNARKLPIAGRFPADRVLHNVPGVDAGLRGTTLQKYRNGTMDFIKQRASAIKNGNPRKIASLLNRYQVPACMAVESAFWAAIGQEENWSKRLFARYLKKALGIGVWKTVLKEKLSSERVKGELRSETTYPMVLTLVEENEDLQKDALSEWKKQHGGRFTGANEVLADLFRCGGCQFVAKLVPNFKLLNDGPRTRKFMFFMLKLEPEEQKKALAELVAARFKRDRPRTAAQLSSKYAVFAAMNPTMLQAVCDEYFEKPVDEEAARREAIIQEMLAVQLPADFNREKAVAEIADKKSLAVADARRLKIAGLELSVLPGNFHGGKQWILQAGGAEAFDVFTCTIFSGSFAANANCREAASRDRREKLVDLAVYAAHMLYVKSEQQEEQAFVRKVRKVGPSKDGTKRRVRSSGSGVIGRRSPSMTLARLDDGAARARKMQTKRLVLSSRTELAKLLKGEAVDFNQLYLYVHYDEDDVEGSYRRLSQQEIQARAVAGTLQSTVEGVPEIFYITRAPHTKVVGKRVQRTDEGVLIITNPVRSEGVEERSQNELRALGLSTLGEHALDDLRATFGMLVDVTADTVEDEGGKPVDVVNADTLATITKKMKVGPFAREWAEAQVKQLKSEVMSWPSGVLERGELTEDMKGTLRKLASWECELSGQSAAEFYDELQRRVTQDVQPRHMLRESAFVREEEFNRLYLHVVHEMLFMDSPVHETIVAHNEAQARIHVQFLADGGAKAEARIPEFHNVQRTYVSPIFKPLSQFSVEDDSANQ